MWDKEKLALRDYYLTNGGHKTQSPTKKNKLAANKLVLLGDDIKVELMKSYLQKCKIEFNICFIEYRLDLNPSNFFPIIYSQLDMFKE